MSTVEDNRHIRVVIIDDEQEIFSLTERYFTKKGYSVKTYDNPVTALASIHKETDLIFLDIMMPQMNGLDLLPRLQEKLPNAKVIMMTAFSTLDKVLNAHRYGATDYIMKPFPSLDALIKKSQEVLDR
jgi:DNA-binding NtrC family response regulator